jgi:hypothetical protein
MLKANPETAAANTQEQETKMYAYNIINSKCVWVGVKIDYVSQARRLGGSKLMQRPEIISFA